MTGMASITCFIHSPFIHSVSLQSGFCQPNSKKLLFSRSPTPAPASSGPAIMPHFSVAFCVVSISLFLNILPLLGSLYKLRFSGFSSFPLGHSICFPGFCCLMHRSWSSSECSGHSCQSFYYLCTHTQSKISAILRALCIIHI